MPASRPHLLVVLIPLLFGFRCKHPPPPDDEEEIEDFHLDPEQELAVTALDPARVTPNTPLAARLYGSAFNPGARVFLGETALQKVEWLDEDSLSLQIPGLAVGTYDLRVANPDGAQATLREALSVSEESTPAAIAALSCGSFRVSFDLDQASLNEGAKAELERHAVCFEYFRGPARVEGHCDERGTTDYNLALGERRAAAVRSWLIARGVVDTRIRTVSFGEEQPLDSRHDEAALAANRRAEISVSK